MRNGAIFDFEAIIGQRDKTRKWACISAVQIVMDICAKHFQQKT